MELLLIFILFLLLGAIGVFIYVIINMVKKLEEQEDFIALQQKRINDLENFIQTFSDNLTSIDNTLSQIDSKGTFEADDEVGYTFKSIKLIVSQLQNFNVNYNATQEKR